MKYGLYEIFASLASGNKDIIFQAEKKEISQLSQKKRIITRTSNDNQNWKTKVTELKFFDVSCPSSGYRLLRRAIFSGAVHA